MAPRESSRPEFDRFATPTSVVSCPGGRAPEPPHHTSGRPLPRGRARCHLHTPRASHATWPRAWPRAHWPASREAPRARIQYSRGATDASLTLEPAHLSLLLHQTQARVAARILALPPARGASPSMFLPCPGRKPPPSRDRSYPPSRERSFPPSEGSRKEKKCPCMMWQATHIVSSNAAGLPGRLKGANLAFSSALCRQAPPQHPLCSPDCPARSHGFHALAGSQCR